MQHDNRTLIVSIKSAYGRENIYPVNDTAKLFCSIARTSTLTRDALRVIKQLGYTIEVQQQEAKL